MRNFFNIQVFSIAYLSANSVIFNRLILVFLIPAMLLPGFASFFYFVWLQDLWIAQVAYFGTKLS